MIAGYNIVTIFPVIDKKPKEKDQLESPINNDVFNIPAVKDSIMFNSLFNIESVDKWYNYEYRGK